MTKLFWIDMEMSGLDVDKEVIIEVAACVTDFDLKPLATYHAIVKQPQSYLDNMDEWNTKHHKESGLTALVPKGLEPHQVESDLVDLIDQHFPPDEKVVLAGNSISQDRLFINKYFNKLNQRLHYRNLDVTSWKIIFNEKFKIKYTKKNTHRALDDVKESIAELNFYLQHVNGKSNGSK